MTPATVWSQLTLQKRACAIATTYRRLFCMERQRPGQPDRSPAADIEDTVVRSLKEHLVAKQDGPTLSALPLGNPSIFAELIAGIVVHKDRLVVRFKSDQTDEASDRFWPLEQFRRRRQ